MLKIYAADWCPHCRAALDYLNRNKIAYERIDVDKISPETEAVLDRANGGSWKVPTLENNGVWIPGKPFLESVFINDLRKLGVFRSKNE